MAVVYVNNNPVDIGNEKLNVIQAALKGGVFIPHYCWHPELTVVASCRMCLVEVGDRKPDGSVAMQPKVVPGCQTPAKDGTVIVTNSEKAKTPRRELWNRCSSITRSIVRFATRQANVVCKISVTAMVVPKAG